MPVPSTVTSDPLRVIVTVPSPVSSLVAVTVSVPPLPVTVLFVVSVRLNVSSVDSPSMFRTSVSLYSSVPTLAPEVVTCVPER